MALMLCIPVTKLHSNPASLNQTRLSQGTAPVHVPANTQRKIQNKAILKISHDKMLLRIALLR
jgi:hypothetical protein